MYYAEYKHHNKSHQHGLAVSRYFSSKQKTLNDVCNHKEDSQHFHRLVKPVWRRKKEIGYHHQPNQNYDRFLIFYVH